MIYHLLFSIGIRELLLLLPFMLQSRLDTTVKKEKWTHRSGISNKSLWFLTPKSWIPPEARCSNWTQPPPRSSERLDWQCSHYTPQNTHAYFKSWFQHFPCLLNCERYNSVFINSRNCFLHKRWRLLLLKPVACYNKVGGVEVLRFILLKYTFLTTNYNDTIFCPFIMQRLVMTSGFFLLRK